MAGTASSRAGMSDPPAASERSSAEAVRAVWSTALERSWPCRYDETSSPTTTASSPESASASRPNPSVTRSRSPSRQPASSDVRHPAAADRSTAGASLTAPAAIALSHRQSVAEAAGGDDVAGVGRVGLDLGAQPADVDVDQAAVAEVAVAPDPVEQVLAAEDPAGVERQLDEQPELGLGEVQSSPVAPYDALVGADLEVAER